jgi:hypothetical protein
MQNSKKYAPCWSRATPPAGNPSTGACPSSRIGNTPRYFLNRLSTSPVGCGSGETRTENLAAFLIRYYRTTFLQVLPAYRYLEEQMLAWAEHNWPGEDACLRTLIYDHDIGRQQLLAGRGYQDQGPYEKVRIYDLQQPYPAPVLPDGFRFATFAEVNDPAGRIALENAVWGVELGLDWFRGKSSSPIYSFDWDLLVLSPENRQATFPAPEV